MPRIITYAEALREAQDYCLSAYPETYLMGLGVPDPKGIFGSTLALQEKYGDKRVFDVPLSENALTGVAIGSAITGSRPILTHQRVEFALVSIEQIVNQAAKWHYMFGGRMKVPLVIRMIIGRGWGQGPQHSQSLQALFAHIPGLKVIMPATPHDAKGMLISAIEDENPVICLEHRWLYNLEEDVPEGDYRVPIGTAKRLREGNDITIVSLSYMTTEALHAWKILEREGISCDILDLRTVRPIDWKLVHSSVQKTGRLLALDTEPITGSISGEIIANVSIECHDILKQAPQRIALPDFPTPTSSALTNGYYKRA
ncbi:MAG: transketolase C-terminal domain-containing protein, partial [Opitutales bacterium]